MLLLSYMYVKPAQAATGSTKYVATGRVLANLEEMRNHNQLSDKNKVNNEANEISIGKPHHDHTHLLWSLAQCSRNAVTPSLRLPEVMFFAASSEESSL